MYINRSVFLKFVVIQGYARQKITSYHAALALFHIDTNQMNVFHKTKKTSHSSIHNGEESLRCQGITLPPRGTSTGCGNGLMGTSASSTNGCEKFCP